MNTHLNLIAERELKLSETLKSFAIEPVSQNVEPPKHRIRRLVLLTCLFSLFSVTAASVVIYRQDLVRRIESMAALLSKPAAVPEKAVQAKQSTISNPAPAAREITGSGFVVAPRMTTIFSKYEGRVTEIAVETGDVVQAGQILVMLDDAGARFAVEQARAAKAAADLVLIARTIDLTQSRASLARIETLSAKDAASRQQLEEARTASEQASNAVEQARQSVASTDLSIRIAGERLDELTVRAPFAGTVTRLDAHIGDTVLARVDSVRENQSLLTITDTTSLMIDADVTETNIAALRQGLRGEAVLDGFPDRPFTVEVWRLAPIASSEKGTITLRLALDHPPKGIRPNMAARIRIPLNDTGDMIQ
jgi:RND family efflux transporter MFP subunit